MIKTLTGRILNRANLGSLDIEVVAIVVVAMMVLDGQGAVKETSRAKYCRKIPRNIARTCFLNKYHFTPTQPGRY